MKAEEKIKIRKENIETLSNILETIGMNMQDEIKRECVSPYLISRLADIAETISVVIKHCVMLIHAAECEEQKTKEEEKRETCEESNGK